MEPVIDVDLGSWDFVLIVGFYSLLFVSLIVFILSFTSIILRIRRGDEITKKRVIVFTVSALIVAFYALLFYSTRGDIVHIPQM